MTTDRTALEAARDALPPLPPLPASHYVPDTDPAFTAQQMRDYAAQAVTAALSSPPVLPPVAWCELTLDGKSIAHFDGKPMVMVGPVGNECHPHALYLAAPQASAPALDDARDAARWRFVRSPQISTSEHHALIEAIRSDEGEHLDAAIDALMQQEPRS